MPPLRIETNPVVPVIREMTENNWNENPNEEIL
jgi:hypothetical protein